MKPIDWTVLAAWLVFLVGYGLYRGRGSGDVNKYLLGGRSMPWYAMGLSILATQASAVTFISTTGQGYVDGLRFAQFYLGLPLAMIVICIVAVPVFRRANVYTAYEFLERRFDAKTRALVSVIFLIQRGLSAGIGLYAPAAALSTVLGWSDRWMTVVIGLLVIAYTVTGGIKALTWADVAQMTMIFIALLMSLFVAIHAFPANIGMGQALRLAGATGHLKIIDLKLDWSNRYNLWSGLIGGGFLALAYFGCDQSQVQRYLTGKSVGESRLGLLFNAVVKVPMQLLILFIGAMVYVLSIFSPSPAIFQPQLAEQAMKSSVWPETNARHQNAFARRKQAALDLVHGATPASITAFRESQANFERVHRQALSLAGNGDDTNFIFLSFVTHFLPLGVLGLTIGVIFSASMGSTSGEINSLATVSVIDIYRRYIVRSASDHHYLFASRCFTAAWGLFAISFAAFGARGFGALIERVNIVGSLFYGGMLGVFVLAFGFRHVRGTAAFSGVVAGEAVIFAVAAGTRVSFLWYNVLGCCTAIGVALILQWFEDLRAAAQSKAV